MTHFDTLSLIGSIWKNKYTSRTAEIIEEESLGKNGIVYTLEYHEFDEIQTRKDFRINGKHITRYWDRID